MDKAGKGYWNTRWALGLLPVPFSPDGRGLNNYVRRKLHRHFERIFAGTETKGKTILEIGCGGSSFLPYFSKYFGFEVYGIDYSPIGCERARAVLRRDGVEGEVFLGDLFSPPTGLLGRFDFVWSYGVVEHFTDTARCVEAISNFLKSSGIALTLVPNLVGIHAPLQKVLSREIYDIHVPLSREDLAAAHGGPGLQVESCEYILPLNLNVLNIENWPKTWRYQVVIRLRSWISKLFWLADDFLPILKPNRWTSPYIICVARKRCA